ncbi:zinc ribbon domain-containing protein [Oscillospiraceae bacterium]|nr:zinc ribbon domain-containing protein [Oscillospiraceae bacterium]DAK36455.1 MAG TPA: zinc-ribbon containing domain protein [Caudoviricetes sp.]
MFCPNCGMDCEDANFCPGCGRDLREVRGAAAAPPTEAAPGEAAAVPAQAGQGGGAEEAGQEYPPLREPYVQEINGIKVDLNKLIRAKGLGAFKFGAYGHLVARCNITFGQAKKILNPLFEYHIRRNEKVSFGEGLLAELNMGSDQAAEEKKRLQELKRSGQVYCPKCHSVSVTANKKGFGFARGAVGLTMGIEAGMLAGGIGSKKVVCTCLNCGYQWKPGKK